MILGVGGSFWAPKFLGSGTDEAGPSQGEPVTKRKSAAEQLAEGKALLDSIRKARPKLTKQEQEILKKEKAHLFIILPKHQKAKFLNANSKARICASYVQSCSVPRDVDVRVQAPGFTTRILSSESLQKHAEPTMRIQLKPRPKKKK